MLPIVSIVHSMRRQSKYTLINLPLFLTNPSNYWPDSCNFIFDYSCESVIEDCITTDFISLDPINTSNRSEVKF